jgi:hypothetical protein
MLCATRVPNFSVIAFDGSSGEEEELYGSLTAKKPL